MSDLSGVGAGDVLAIRTPDVAGKIIRFGAGLADGSTLANHIAILHHQSDGRWWAIEGRPGGVGWADATAYLESPFTISNQHQGKEALWQKVCDITESALHTPYDWPAIAADALNDLHLPVLWGERQDGVTPGHVVCSSLAAWAYAKAGLACPVEKSFIGASSQAYVQPSDWVKFIIDNHYE